MKLKDWMEKEEMTDEAFAKRIGKSRLQVLRYRHGEQIPGRDAMKKIVKATSNQVQPASFYE